MHGSAVLFVCNMAQERVYISDKKLRFLVALLACNISEKGLTLRQPCTNGAVSASGIVRFNCYGVHCYVRRDTCFTCISHCPAIGTPRCDNLVSHSCQHGYSVHPTQRLENNFPVLPRHTGIHFAVVSDFIAYWSHIESAIFRSISEHYSGC